MPSFDIVSEIDLQEVRNGIDQASREINTRFDFKGSNAKIEHVDNKLTLTAQNEFQIKQMLDILQGRLIKRGIALGSLEAGKITSNLNDAKQEITLKQGIDSELAKKITKIIKDSKIKVQAAIQGDQVRITGKKRDDLQEVIALMRNQKIDLPLQFINFRD